MNGINISNEFLVISSVLIILMMETELVFETLAFDSTLTRLMARVNSMHFYAFFYKVHEVNA
jgi:hypothetical protein